MKHLTTSLALICFVAANAPAVLQASALTSKLGSMIRSCIPGYSSVAKTAKAAPAQPVFEPGSTLDKLQKALAKKEEREILHQPDVGKRVYPTKIRLKDGEVTIEAGYLHWEKDRDVIRLLSAAMKEGKIDRFDAQRVTGGKALNYILAMAERAPSDKPVEFVGEVRMFAMMMGRELDIESGRAGARAWTETENKNFEAAIEKMKIKDACATHWPESRFERCGDMHFSFMSNRPDEIVWWP